MAQVVRLNVANHRPRGWRPKAGHNGGPELEIELPELHEDQLRAHLMPARFKAVRAGRRWGKCVADGSRIAMADGTYRSVEDVRPGDLVLTANEVSYQIEAKPVLSVANNGIKETVVVRTAGRNLRCTPNHPLLVNNQWIEARHVAVGDLVAVPRNSVFGDRSVPVHEVDFLAIWLAEGKGYTVSNGTPAILETLKVAISGWGLHLRKQQGSAVDWRMTDGLGTGGLRIKRNKARLWLEAEGLWDKNSKTKFIPDWVYGLPKNQLARFLNLFIACDGCICRRCKNTWAVEIGLANERLVRQLAELFLKFGIRGQIRSKIHNEIGKDGKAFVSWRFIASDASTLLIFADEIGALSKETQVAEMRSAALASTGSCNDYLPISYADVVPTHLIYLPQITKRMAQARDVVAVDVPSGLRETLNSWRKQTIERLSARRYAQLRPWISDRFDHIATGGLVWEQVTEVEQTSATRTWDLALADNHNFFANDICVHNTALGETVACDAAIRGQYIGWFSPEYKFLAEAYSDIASLLTPIIWSSSKVDGVIRTTTRGRIDFWSLDNERAGRSRKYHGIIIDEAAFTKANMLDIWNKSIRPTLVDYRGWALVLSNTNGIDPTNFLYAICNDPKHSFRQYHAPTSANPYMPPEELAEIEANTHPLVFQQEYLADFVDWSGSAFFSQLSLLDGNAHAYAMPARCDAVFATIDTAIKDGKKHDGTGVVFWAINRFTGIPLMVLDWDVIQVEGSVLELWLPQVYQRLEDLARQCGARQGSLGAFIEDKGSGTILLQQAKRHGWAAHPIESKLTDLGKDARCISVSGYVHGGKVKMCGEAYDKVVTYKGVHRNHMLGQIVGYRVGIDQGQDDILDCFSYGIAIALGDSKGF